MRIIFVRHGEASSPLDKFFSGEKGDDTRILTEKGVKQAKLLAKHLGKYKFDEFYCSDLKRAKQTSLIVSKKIKLNPVIEKSLNEFDSETLKKNKHKVDGEHKKHYLGLISFLNKITKNPEQEKTILIISHGNMNRVILSHFFKLDIKRLIPFRQMETTLNCIHWSKTHKNWRLDYWNNYNHLG